MEPAEIFQYRAMPDLSISCMALCTLGLQEYELESYIILLKEGPMTVNELKTKIKKSRATAQRIVSQLMSKEIVYRRRKTFLNGGYVYQYYAIPLEKFKEKMKKNLTEWFNKSINVIERITDPIEL
ncbi:MAG: helix-turn-helix domain-containing protein [Candidatus Odinarchaeia archaeon]